MVTVCRTLHDRKLFAMRPASCTQLTFALRKTRLTAIIGIDIMDIGPGMNGGPTNSLMSLWSICKNSPYFHLELTRDPLFASHLSRKRPLCGGLVVWESIILDERIPLPMFGKSSMTSLRCKDDILAPYVCLFRIPFLFRMSLISFYGLQRAPRIERRL